MITLLPSDHAYKLQALMLAELSTLVTHKQSISLSVDHGVPQDIISSNMTRMYVHHQDTNHHLIYGLPVSHSFNVIHYRVYRTREARTKCRRIQLNLQTGTSVWPSVFNPLQPKRRPLYLKTQSVPRCKHFSSGL